MSKLLMMVFLSVYALGSPIGPLQQQPVTDETAVELRATERVFPEVRFITGPVRQDRRGNYYVSDRHTRTIRIYNEFFNPIGTIGGMGRGAADLGGTETFAVTADGKVVTVGLEEIKIFNSAGVAERTFRSWRTMALDVMSTGEILVSGFPEDKLIHVFSPEGKLLREFGEPVFGDEDQSNKGYLNTGLIAVDSDDNIYYAFRFLPEPTIRKYDREGNLLAEFHPDAKMIREAGSESQRRIEKMRAGDRDAGFRPVFATLTVDEATGDIWASMGPYIYRLSPDGKVRSAYRFVSPEGFPAPVRQILLQKDRMIIAASSWGVLMAPKPRAN